MMIDSEVLKEFVNYICVEDRDVITKKSIMHIINRLESDSQGEWLWLGDNPHNDHKWSCNKCGRGVKQPEKFCPNCGVHMIKGGGI